jgi:hypothetical protein
VSKRLVWGDIKGDETLVDEDATDFVPFPIPEYEKLK